MNLAYVKGYLKDKLKNITKEDIEKLIEDIESYIKAENKFEDIASIMRTVHEYNMSYLHQIQEYELISEDDLLKRTEKARGILCTLSSLHTYLVLTRAHISESTYNMKNIRSYVADLESRKEHFRTEKMAWITVLKSLSQEMNYRSEMRRMDLEDKLGYGNNGKKDKEG